MLIIVSYVKFTFLGPRDSVFGIVREFGTLYPTVIVAWSDSQLPPFNLAPKSKNHGIAWNFCFGARLKAGGGELDQATTTVR